MAPPSYKPLTLPALPEGLKEAFITPQVGWDDAMNNALSLRAKELANQTANQQIERNQIALDQQQGIIDALKERYGGQTDENGEPLQTVEYDPARALDVAKEAALKTGNLNTAIQIEQAQNEFARTGRGRSPLADTVIAGLRAQGLDVPDGATEDDVNLLLATKRASTAQSRDENITNRFREGLDVKQSNRMQDIASSSPGGYEPNIDPETGQGPTKKDGEKFTAAVSAHTRIQNNLNALEASLAKESGNDPTSPEFAKQRSLLADIQIALKEKNNFGASLTGNEAAMNNAVLPEILARTDVGLGDALVSAGLGRDPVSAINTLRQMLNEDLGSQEMIYKQKRKAQPVNTDFNAEFESPPATMMIQRARGTPKVSKGDAMAELKRRGLIP